jgi:exodeoxyribonuclease VII large subunit
MKKTIKQEFTNIPAQFANFPSFSVNQLRDHLSRIVKSNFSTPIIVRGVIASDPKLYPSFVFFDIRDEQKNLSFTLYGYIGNFYNIEKKLKATGVIEKLSQDVPVMLIVEPIISTQKKVDIRLNIIDVIPEYTTSIIANAKNVTLNKLSEEGIVNLQKDLALPVLVKNIALISSDQGTSVQDISSAMGATVKFYKIIFKSTRVEGNQAVPEIIEAIDLFSKYAKRLNIDAIVVARGGGSATDLSIFDDYELCKTVCLCKIPIITAIGHDKDEHAIEVCSHLTPIPSTPSGIGAFFKQHMHDLKEDLEVSIQDVAEKVVQRFIREESIIRNNLSSVLSSIKNVFRINILKIKNLIDLVVKDSRSLFNYHDERLRELNKLLMAYNHNTVLQRGYAVVWSNDGKVVKETQQMTETADIEFVDGRVRVRKNEAKQVRDPKKTKLGKDD